MAKSQEKTLGNNLIGIDFLRFVAAFSVFYYHQHIGDLLSKYTHLNFLKYTDILGERYAVPLFFLISGFCIHYAAQKSISIGRKFDLKKFYLNRFWRIYPPYFIALITSIALNSFLPYSANSTSSDFFVHLLVIQGLVKNSFNTINLVLWTITIELCLYLIYPIFFYLKQKYTVNTAFLYIAIVSSISMLYFQFYEQDLSLPKRYFVLNIWVGWCFGAWLCDKILSDISYFRSKQWMLISVILLAAFLCTFAFHWKNDILLMYNIYIMVWAPILIYTVISEAFFVRHIKLMTIPVALGVSSYSLYLLHQPLINFKNYLITSYTNDKNLSMILMVLSIIVIPLICYFNYRLFELPFIKYRKGAAQKS